MNNVESAAAPATTTTCARSCSPTVGAIVARCRSPFPPRCTSAIPAGNRSAAHRLFARDRVVIGLVCFLVSPRCCWRRPLVHPPILLYIGLVIGAQAFQASPKEHAPAVVLAIIPNVAAWDICRSTARSPRPHLGRQVGAAALADRRRVPRHGAARRGAVLAACPRAMRRSSSTGIQDGGMYAFAGAVLASSASSTAHSSLGHVADGGTRVCVVRRDLLAVSGQKQAPLVRGAKKRRGLRAQQVP